MSASEDPRQFLEQFLSTQYQKGLNLWLEQGQLRFKGPRAILNKDLIQALKNNKADIVAILEQQAVENDTVVSDVVADNIVANNVVAEDMIEAEYPLSMSQAAIWMLYQFAPNSPAYNTTFCAKLSSASEINILKKAYQHTVNRHAMLRTRFLDGENGPIQQVLKVTDASIECTDGSQWSEEAVNRWLKQEAVAPFDLTQAQPLRVKCLETPTGNILIATIHHVAADLWSLLLIAGDLFSDYQHYCKSGYFEVKKETHRYQQHVEWQQQYMRSKEVESVKTFWRDYLQNAVLSPDMPTDFSRPPIMQLSTARHSTEIDGSVARSVRQFCKEQTITPYVLFESAFQLLLYRYIRHSDFLIGTPTFGRSKQSFERVVGDFANPVVLRARIEKPQVVAQWLGQNQKDLFKIMALQDFPFPALVDLVNPTRDASRTPLFQHMFVWHQGNKETFLQQNLIEEILPLSGPCGSPYDILLSVSDLGDGFECHWTYQTSLYDEASIQQFSQEYEQLIYALLAIDTDSTIDNLLDDIECPSLDYCGKPTGEVFLGGIPLASVINIDENTGSDEFPPSYSLVKNDYQKNTDEGVDSGKYDSIACLHEVGLLQIHSKNTSTFLPMYGRYNSKGHIVISDIQSGWGIVNKTLTNLRQRVSLNIASESLPLFLVRCFLASNKNANRKPKKNSRNILYVETVDDNLIHDLTQGCPEFDDIVHLPRFVFDNEGNIDLTWLYSIPVFDVKALPEELRANQSKTGRKQPIVITRESETSLSKQIYPNVKADQDIVSLNREGAATSSFSKKSQELALLSGASLQSEVPFTNIVEGLIHTANTHPSAAVYFVDQSDNASVLLYADLLKAAERLALALRKKGISSEQVVILQIANREDYFIVWWALLWLGAMPLTIAVPTRYDDTQPIARKLKNVFNSLPSSIVISDAGEGIQQYITRNLLDLADIRSSISNGLGELAPAETLPYYRENCIAFLQLTSGSTGTPKVIQMSHSGILHQVYAASEHNGFQEGDRTLNWLPFDHVVPILTTHLRDVMLGLDQYQVSTQHILADPLAWIRLMEKYEVNHSWAPNFGFKLVVDALKKLSAGELIQHIGSLSNIKTLMNAGEQVLPRVIKDFVLLLQPFGLVSTSMQPAFGMAESCTCITYQNQFSVGDNQVSTFVSLGSVIPGVEIRIVDENNHLLKEGQIGRMQIRGPIVSPGYLNNPSANNESFVGEGWFNSGDLGFVNDGELILTGREKEMIIIRGSNYYCYEIEESITRCSSVLPTYVAVFSVENDQLTEELVVCYVGSDSARSDKGASFENDIQQINGIINADFGIEARYIIVVDKDNFHKTTSGKIQRSQFRQFFEDGKYQQQCTLFDEFFGIDRNVPYHVYQTCWQKISGSVFPNRLKCRYGLTSVFCFDRRLANRIERIGLEQKVVYVDNLFEVISATEVLLEQSTEKAVSATLLFSVPPVQDTLSTTQLAIEIAKILTQLIEQMGESDNVSGSARGVFQVILTIPSSNSPEVSSKQELPAIPWAKLLVEAISAEITEHQPSLFRLRVVFENQLCDAMFRKLRRYDSVNFPLLIDGDTVFRPALTPVSIAIDNPNRLDQNVYVITGGLGGVGLQLTKTLLEKQCPLIIIGRRAVDDNVEVKATLDQLNGLYGKGSFCYQSISKLSSELIEGAVNKGLQELDVNEVNGIFHLAGNYLKSPVSLMSEDLWFEVLDAKYQGGAALGGYLQSNWPEASLVFFSSVNSYFGGADIAGYGVANALQNQLAEYFNQEGIIKCFSLNWSLWPELGIASAFTSQDVAFAKNKGFLPMSASRDMLWLEAVMADKPGCYWFGLNQRKADIASEIDWKHLTQGCSVRALFHIEENNGEIESQLSSMISATDVEQWLIENQHTHFDCVPPVKMEVESLNHQLPTNSRGAILFSQLLDLSVNQPLTGEPPRNKMDQLLMDIWQSLLGSRVCHIDQTFFECGGNSVVVTQLAYKLTLQLQRQLPLSAIFEYPTIRSYSDFLQSCEGKSDSNTAFVSEYSNLELANQLEHIDGYQLSVISANNARPENTIIYIPALIGLPHSYQHLLKTFSHCNQVLLSQDVLTQPATSIHLLASEYIELLRSRDIDLHNAVFVGWSFGGCIAYEMVNQLMECKVSRSAPRLVVVDSGIRDAIPPLLGQDHVAMTLFSKDLGLLGDSPTYHFSSVEELQRELAEKVMSIDKAVLEQWYGTYKNNMQLLREFNPERLQHKNPSNLEPAPIYLKAKGNALGTDDMGWGNKISQFRVIESTADHQQVIYDSQLLDLMSGCLQGG